MTLSSYILEQFLRRLQLPDDAIKRFQLASALSDVEGNGFPRELFQLSAPMVVRGLLNYGILQMNRDWIYPFWVHKQLDAGSESYVARSQNPLLINITHRNWTALGTQHGFHEAIVDPRGLATPLPREWSVDTWLVVDRKAFFPSRAPSAKQTFDTAQPRLETMFDVDGMELSLEHFVGSTRHEIDILFAGTSVTNRSDLQRSGMICIAIRPFNPEGVAPISSIDFKSPRVATVNGATGVVFAESPAWVACSSYSQGDLAKTLQREGLVRLPMFSSTMCSRGLAHAVAAFPFTLEPNESKSVHFSIALAEEQQLRRRRSKPTWRVSFDKRKEEQRIRWHQEISGGAHIKLADEKLQNLLDASRLTLLQFNDGEFISPGPFLYHHFWYRDAALMIRALDVLGFHKRSRQVINAFPDRLTGNGFFRGPDGEWDSNGAAIWTVHQHFLLNRSHSWLRRWYGDLVQAARWIIRKRKSTSNGLMPKSLSAEHLGTVDQYYWDTFWSLAGLRSMCSIARLMKNDADVTFFERSLSAFEADIRTSFDAAAKHLGIEAIPATPSRNFDESAIGSICSLYPLELFPAQLRHPANTARLLRDRYVDERGFLHPFIHSGYNPYLTLQIAHSLLLLGEIENAWSVADTIFRQAGSPYSLPEAIHPRTGGGVMGDGHHGWAAAEIILFLRNCLVREEGDTLTLFKGSNNRLVRRGAPITLAGVPTTFGTISCSLSFEARERAVVEFKGEFDQSTIPAVVEIHLPFATKRAAASVPHHLLEQSCGESHTIVRCSPGVRTLFFDL